MTVEDALRKIELLRRVSADKGAVPAEREAAYRLQKVLMERYAIKARDVPEAPLPSASRLSWSYWQELLDEFDLRLDRLGNRGSVTVGSILKVFIRLDKSDWWVDQKSPKGWQTVTRDRGIESLRTYLKEHAPRSYSFLRR